MADLEEPLMMPVRIILLSSSVKYENAFDSPI
jgi:hypothetical protein